jgi:hypothetical protein
VEEQDGKKILGHKNESSGNRMNPRAIMGRKLSSLDWRFFPRQGENREPGQIRKQLTSLSFLLLDHQVKPNTKTFARKQQCKPQQGMWHLKPGWFCLTLPHRPMPAEVLFVQCLFHGAQSTGELDHKISNNYLIQESLVFPEIEWSILRSTLSSSLSH